MLTRAVIGPPGFEDHRAPPSTTRFAPPLYDSTFFQPPSELAVEEGLRRLVGPAGQDRAGPGAGIGGSGGLASWKIRVGDLKNRTVRTPRIAEEEDEGFLDND